MSQSTWLVAAVVPGLKRQPLKKLDVDPETLLKLLHREACAAGRPIQAHRCSRTRPDATASG